MGIFEFVTIDEIPFTMDLYEKIRTTKYDNDDFVKKIRLIPD